MYDSPFIKLNAFNITSDPWLQLHNDVLVVLTAQISRYDSGSKIKVETVQLGTFNETATKRVEEMEILHDLYKNEIFSNGKVNRSTILEDIADVERLLDLYEKATTY